MASRGPKKKPTELKIRQGTARKDRLLTNEIKPDIVSLYPKPPSYLSKYAMEEWDVVLPQLVQLNILAKVDMSMVTAYCMEWAAYREADDELKKKGKVIKSANGTLIPHPMNGIRNTALKNAMRLAAEFGFTPSSRTSIGGPKKDAEDPIDKLQEMLNAK